MTRTVIGFSIQASRIVPRVQRRRRNGARQIGAEGGEEEEFALRVDASPLRQVAPQVSFRQEVREEWRQAGCDRTNRGDEAAALSAEGQAERQTLRIVDILLFEREQIAVTRQTVDDTNRAVLQPHGERLDVRRISVRHAAAPARPILHRPHRGDALQCHDQGFGRGSAPVRQARVAAVPSEGRN